MVEKYNSLQLIYILFVKMVQNLTEKPKAYITKVVVEGFKSYGRKRKEIPLGEGFIAIVGPNGSGKSNIGDAISFALGLASSKVLRAKNLSYLIWSKGDKRADYALVEVHFKNEGAFPIEEEEIVFSRKVFPNGRSVFKINGKPVKERDVKELLTRAGITENTYNVVLQGDIIHFLKMTPIQRRKLIEDIAGIGEFDEKKQKALEELGEVEVKLKELKLILDELKERLKVLERDKKALLEYRELSQEREELKRKLTAKEYHRYRKRYLALREELERKEQGLEQNKKEKEEFLKKLLQVEANLEEVESLLEPYREKLGKFQSEEEYLLKEIETLKGNLTKLSNQKGELQKLLEELKGELSEKVQQKEKVEKEIETLKGELKPLEEKLKELDKELSKLEEELRSAIKGLEESEKKLKTLREEEAKKDKLLRGLLREIDTLEGKIAQTEENLKSLKEQKSELLRGFLGNFSYEKQKWEKLAEEKEKSYHLLRERLEQIDGKLREVKEKKEELSRELLKLEAQLHISGNDAVEFLKKNVEGVYGTVAELIRVGEEEYLTAVEIAGGNRLRYVVVENEDTAKRCIRLLKEHNLGRLTFIPLNRIRANPPTFLPRVRGVIDFVYKLVEFDPHFEKAVLYVFGDTVLVEDFETAKRLGIGNYRMVTLEGELFEKGGTITGGTVKAQNLLREGFLKFRVEELRQEVTALEKREEKLLKEREKLKEKLWEEEGTLNYARRKLKELESDHSNALEKLKKVEERIAKGEEYLNYLKKELKEKDEKVDTLQEEIVSLQEEIERLNRKREEYLKVVSQSGLEEIKTQRNGLLKEISTLKGEIQKLEKTLIALQKEEENLKAKIEETQKAIEEKEREIEKTKLLIEEKEQRLAQVREEFKKAGENISKLIERRELLKGERDKLKGDLALVEAKGEKLSREREKLLMELTRLKENMENLLNSLGGKPIEEPKEETSSLKKLLAEIENRLSALGNVNFRAEEEYEEVFKRYREYGEKYQTLEREKKALIDFIGEIEKKKERIFKETFNAINKNFKEIFAFLSPGGKAYMEIEKPHDIFSGGINMFVKPRGKEVKYLEAMSGGEKTLAALSLIFALQRYKPAPFYYFDEVDAHLDEVNAVKVGELIKEYSKQAQFIVVTLRESVAYLADKLIGVTSRGGVSEVYLLDPAKLEK
ncbi:MAG: chromosome segregation protein SMC [Gammaproteobacteria bacterium]|nr:MAG: chromosome segregation protein SMC [Gammaproteobacteria bacterium]